MTEETQSNSTKHESGQLKCKILTTPSSGKNNFCSFILFLWLERENGSYTGSCSAAFYTPLDFPNISVKSFKKI